MARILVLDDAKDIRMAIAAELPGHSLKVCAEGFEALEAIVGSYRGVLFDLMIFDAICPNIDGLTLTKIVRLIEGLGMVRRTRIALMSAHGKMIGENLLEESGADFYWQKPEQLLTLRDFVKETFPVSKKDFVK